MRFGHCTVEVFVVQGLGPNLAASQALLRVSG